MKSMEKNRDSNGKFIKGHKQIGGFQKGHRQYSDKGCFRKGDMSGEKNSNWKGGKTLSYRRNHPPRPKAERCEICGSMGRICFDHDHKTEEFRGWICDRCNVALGMANENPEILVAIAEYIKKYKESNK